MTTGVVGPNGQWQTPADVPGAPGGLRSPSRTTWAAKPTASTAEGAVYRMTDVGPGQSGTGGGNFFYSNGTRWKPINGEATLDAVDTANVGAANTTEQDLTPNKVVVPAGVVSFNGDRLFLHAAFSKSGSSDVCTIRVRWGPLGTAADPLIASLSGLTGAAQSYGVFLSFKRVNASSLQRQGNADANSSFNGGNAGVYPSAVAGSDMGVTPMFLTITAQMTGGTEAPTLQDMLFLYKATDNG